MVTAKRVFYDRICQGAENPIAFDIVNRLVLRTSGLRSRSMLRKARQQQSIKEIEQLVEAIQRRDVTAAREAAIFHVEHAAVSALGLDEDMALAGAEMPPVEAAEQQHKRDLEAAAS
jgi:DNA-binding GntR family transcriptional regulator